MTDQEKRTERALNDAGCELVEECIRQMEIAGGSLSRVEIAHALRQYGPLLYKAGAAHVFVNFDCYPKPK